ncbi:ferrous iron transport protein B [Paenibacillus sp. J5C_2022]|uniref:ferrous iron transport protein B n=1 Tax=Paenibacillus sp. J5C2022 TaxID=2977129 RepID=UPI0021D31336|nr:ferrous iron transport protein B [Paenibacillus sp. J5C2022]MCU6707958.1 ferrous iron transport protein B [Paenibacillus sp. J5C2022]
MTRIALAGNPNIGKTSLFNQLTGSYEYVGNWSGVTVEQKVGVLTNKAGELIDLPGVYTLAPISKDEGVVSQFLLNETFSHILNIVDASQIERNLHLTVQLLEYGKPVMIGLNMIDVAAKRGIVVNPSILAKKLGVGVKPVIARTGQGCQELLGALSQNIPAREPLVLDYGGQLENGIRELLSQLPDMDDRNKRWLAIQFFEGNYVARHSLEHYIDSDSLQFLYDRTEKAIIESGLSKRMQDHIYRIRKQYIQTVLNASYERQEHKEDQFTEIIDQIVTNRFLGIPIFLLFMFLIFKLTFDWLGSPLSDALDSFFSGPLTDMLSGALTKLNVNSFIQALVLNGIVAGVGGVLVFVPQIFILFFFISLIEDSGYMARVAMVMDRLLEKTGLNGKAFIPMIIGFGCNVPGIMAARTIEQPKERLLTVILTPLMSCSARLAVYSLFVGTFFENHQALIVLSLYVMGVVVALLLAKLFSLLFMKNESSLFVIELPPYRVPQGKTLIRSTWDKGKGFVKKAGTLIFGGTVVIWLLSYTGPGGFDVEIDKSFMAILGGGLAPIFAPIGFGTWQAGAALITGFLAKEVVVSTMNIIYFVPNTDMLQGLLATQFTPLSAYSFMAFILLYVPCLATVAIIQKETKSKKWTLFSILYALVIAYLISFIVYHAGRLLGFE